MNLASSSNACPIPSISPIGIIQVSLTAMLKGAVLLKRITQ